MANNVELNQVDLDLLKTTSDIEVDKIKDGAVNIRKNGQLAMRHNTEDVVIETKKDKSGIDIYVKDNVKFTTVHIPVILTKEGLTDLVYNDFHIGKNSKVYIVAGCSIHNDSHAKNQHDGIHSFYLEENSNVTYVENHYGEGSGDGKRVLNPITNIYMKKGSKMEMKTTQIKGVDSTVRQTYAKLEEQCNLSIIEKIMTSGEQFAKTDFIVDLDGKDSSCHLTSRSVATENSHQEFVSTINGNEKCFAHSECDAIIKDNGKVIASPKIVANNVDANLIHEAAIGKIAGEQLIKLETLGLTPSEAEQKVIEGFLS